jgi:exo-1,4-beta-D-glucosaminidase
MLSGKFNYSLGSDFYPRRTTQGRTMNSGRPLAVTFSVLAQFLLASSLMQLILTQPLVCQDAAKHPGMQDQLALHEGWALQSSAKVEAKGEVISTGQFVAAGWQEVTVPTTVVAAQVKSKALPDPFFAMNLRQFPGVAYEVGKNFSGIAMPSDSPYAVSWWYRKQFAVPASYKGKTVWLNFAGINYRANIWLNGKQIANSSDVAGAWRTYEFNVTDTLNAGGDNTLAVQVWAPT